MSEDEVDRRARELRRLAEDQRRQQQRVDDLIVGRERLLATALEGALTSIADRAAGPTRYRTMIFEDQIICFVMGPAEPVRVNLVRVAIKQSHEISHADWNIYYEISDYLPVEGEPGCYEVGEMYASRRNDTETAVSTAVEMVLDCLAFLVVEGFELLEPDGITRYATKTDGCRVELPDNAPKHEG